jgi:putative ABC transport system permease protein
VTLATATFDRRFSTSKAATAVIFVRTTRDAADVQDAMKKAVADFPTVKVMTKKQYIDLQNAQMKPILGMFYVLLGLSVVISVFGIVNTLALAVFERTRELGMLRAVGMTKRQTRRMIRHESVTISLIGAALGIPLGILLAALVTSALSKYGVVFSISPIEMAIFVVLTVFAGILAAILPARRASRLNVLEALQYESRAAATVARDGSRPTRANAHRARSARLPRPPGVGARLRRRRLVRGDDRAAEVLALGVERTRALFHAQARAPARSA